MLKFSRKLCEEIENKTVFDEEVELINSTRDILDFQKIILDFRSKKLSEDIYAINNFPTFSRAIESLHIRSLNIISDEVVLMQYKKFINKLVELTSGLSSEQILDLDSREIVVKLLDSKMKLYENIQIILHIISVAATKSSCESILESYVSQYEYACDSRSSFGEDGINDTFEIIKNGPIISKCDKVVKLSLDSYFRSQKKQKYWHFVKKDRAILFKSSRTMYKIGRESSALIFMD